MTKLWSMLVGAALVSVLPVRAAASGGALTLLETGGARSAALGEAYTGVTDDIAAFFFNPASLAGLRSGHASLLYHRGPIDESFGQFSMGAPLRRAGIGLSVAYYDGGDFVLQDGGTTRTVSAQTDLAVSLGYARRVGPVSMGLTAKYLSSRLLDRYSASAFAGDGGLQWDAHRRVRLGASVQNIGTDLTFVEEGDALPRVARLGVAAAVTNGPAPVTLLADGAYFMNESEIKPAVGVEVPMGPLALRGGYRFGWEDAGVTIGMGFAFGSAALDYAYGFSEDLNAPHRFSMSLRFGSSGARTPAIVAIPQEPAAPSGRRRATLGDGDSRPTSAARADGNARQVYRVQPGDSLSRIAQKHYGDARLWQKIYMANRHMIERPADIEPGQDIILP